MPLNYLPFTKMLINVDYDRSVLITFSDYYNYYSFATINTRLPIPQSISHNQYYPHYSKPLAVSPLIHKFWICEVQM